MKKLSVLLLIALQSCTLAINNTMAAGHATDVVDEDQAATADVQAEATLTPGL